MRLLTPVFAPIGARQERRTWTGLRDLLEEGHAVSLLDGYLPEFDVRERHSRVLNAGVGPVRAAIAKTDLTGIPVVRALLVLRALPGRLRALLGGRATPVPPPFTLADMPRAGWTSLAEGPEEVAFGTLTRPWKIGDEAPLAVDRESFAAFTTPGYAKVAFSIRADPDGPCRTLVTTETRVATTDPHSRQRFAAYWVVIGPLSALIRRLILRRLAMHAEPGATHPHAQDRPLGRPVDSDGGSCPASHEPSSPGTGQSTTAAGRDAAGGPRRHGGSR
jgi:hypothetical protein